MKKLILTSILAFISAFAFSGTVTVNGNSCGSLTSAIVGAEGNLEVKTTATCGGVVVPPPEPEPDPLACIPSSTQICLSRPWPNIAQELMSIRNGQLISIKVRTGQSGVGTVYVNNYAGDTAAMQVALATVPGTVDTPATCMRKGFESVSLRWEISGANTRVCQLPPGKDIYLTLKATNCPDRVSCKFYLRAN